MYSFSFNGVRKNNVFILKGKILPVLAPRVHQMLSVPKRPGAIHMGTSTEVRELEIPIAIRKESNQTFVGLKEEIATWLTTETAKPLRMDDEPGRTYFALLNDIGEMEKVGDEYLITKLQFICPDPYRYSDERYVRMQKGTDTTIYNVDVLGNIETYPVTRLDVDRKLNYLSIVTNDNYLQIGAPETVDEKPYEPETRIFLDDCNTVSGWTQATNVDNGYISGEISSNGNYFYPELFGTVIQPPMWQGPSLKKSIGKSLKDFKAQINVQFLNTPAARTGMLEIYFLDSSNQTVAKIGLEDRFAATNLVYGKARIGPIDTGTWLLNSGADNPERWDNYTGILRIQRKNNWWTVYFSTVDEKGVHTYPKGTGGFLTLHDADGKFASDVTQVQVSFRMFPDTDKCDMRVHDIQIWELNEPPTPTTIPVIAMPGDTLEFDHYKNTVRKNGQIVQGLKDFGSNFFPLKPGRNRVVMKPPDAGDLTFRYRERYL